MLLTTLRCLSQEILMNEVILVTLNTNTTLEFPNVRSVKENLVHLLPSSAEITGVRTEDSKNYEELIKYIKLIQASYQTTNP